MCQEIVSALSWPENQPVVGLLSVLCIHAGGLCRLSGVSGPCVSLLLCVCVVKQVSVCCVSVYCVSVYCVSMLLLLCAGVYFEPQDSPSLSWPPFQGARVPVLGYPRAGGVALQPDLLPPKATN